MLDGHANCCDFWEGHSKRRARRSYSIVVLSQLEFTDFSFIVTLTWGGNLVTGPILIYHDELRHDGNDNPMLGDDLDSPGALTCRSHTRPRVFWRNTAGNTIPATDEPGGLNDINVIQNGLTDVPSIARLSRGTTTSPTGNLFDGLLLCRLNVMGDVQDVIANFRYVGLYNRLRPGKCHTIQLSKIIRSYVHCRSWCNHRK